MKQLLATDTLGSYTFDKTAKTITFSGLRNSIMYVKGHQQEFYDAESV